MAPERPRALGARALVFGALLVAGLWAAASLGLFRDIPSVGEAGGRTAWEFLSRALTPALRSEAPPPHGGESLLPTLLEAVRTTLVFAAASLGLAVLLGVGLGFLGSTAWWAGDPAGGRTLVARLLRRTVLPAVYGCTRVLISALRSVHELIWAVLLLSAFGRSDLAAVVAIAIPYAGTVAKIFSELIDEAPRGAALALRGAGATPTQVFAIGLLPRALADLAAYLFYQFECALRSSAILGFFGFPTLGYYVITSFQHLRYGEVWTYLYALLALILLVEVWSGAIRRRMVA
jgi:phosphonate transport system permease protein